MQPLSLASFTEHSASGIHLWGPVNQQVCPSYCCVIFQGRDVPQVFIPPQLRELGDYEEICHTHLRTSFRANSFYFSQGITQEWDLGVR